MTVIGALSSFREPGEMSPHRRAGIDWSGHFRATRRKIANPQDHPSLALVTGVHRHDNRLKFWSLTRASLSESNGKMQFLEDPQFLPGEHRCVHHRVTHGFGNAISSMRSAMTCDSSMPEGEPAQS